MSSVSLSSSPSLRVTARNARIPAFSPSPRGSSLCPPDQPVASSGTLVAADLHTHSPYAYGTSPELTLENAVSRSQLKGIDLRGTGDCLQPQWQDELKSKILETGTGLFILRPEVAEACQEGIPPHLRRVVRLLLSTEVCCAPAGQGKSGKVHLLIFFRSFESVGKFARRVGRYGNLRDGRPTLRLTAKELLSLVLEHGDGSALAPAHVLSPWNSALGSVDGENSLTALFGELTPQLLAVEMGPTATPAMCRRISSLDGHGLFCNSDAHSLENIGREYTLLDVELAYDAIMAALRDPAGERIRGFIKFPAAHTECYFSYCAECDRRFIGTACPRCGGRPILGSQDQTERLADRQLPYPLPRDPACGELLPLHFLIASCMGVKATNQRVRQVHGQLLDLLGNERHILTQATEAEIAVATTSDLAHLIVRQRQVPPSTGFRSQMMLGFE